MQLDKYGEIIPINCYEQTVNTGDLLIANTSEFDLTEGKVYVCRAVQNDIEVENDEGEIERYSQEWFDFYRGQVVKGY
ncbi:hypothetical protein [Paenibacillus illinoisensis]|uniref:Uncharacterized protein n=1 Tax=Paenibacillus illinoisensis TaxID=59845 RepID=A0A2W0C8D3_9BACL|nr:hypothetical protein [Paenibacillus illinoisensis]PYY28264.1 Uncharacterized protein PIL02S_03410 [Paenibacillus illinoisensis]